MLSGVFTIGEVTVKLTGVVPCTELFVGPTKTGTFNGVAHPIDGTEDDRK
jgi:hypothetical protein